MAENNSAEARTGTLIVAGRTITITQSGTSAYTVNGRVTAQDGSGLAYVRLFFSSLTDGRFVPDSVETYNTPTGSTFLNTNHAAYFQDKWRIGRRLTLNLGLRYEHDYERINDGTSPICQTETPFIAGRCFPAVSGVPNFNFVSPRMSAVYDLFGDQKTALKFSMGRYEQAGTTGFANRYNPLALLTQSVSWTDANGDGIPQGELGCVYQTAGCEINVAGQLPKTFGSGSL